MNFTICKHGKISNIEVMADKTVSDKDQSDVKLVSVMARDYGVYRRKKRYVPEGYKTIHGMAIDWKISHRSVKTAINKLGTIVPKKFANDKEVINQYYSPADIDLIYDKLRDLIVAEQPPQGWITVNIMTRDWGIDSRKINAAILTLKNLQSKRCVNEAGHLRTFYSPRAVAIIHDALGDSFSNRRIPSGWKAVRHMSENWSVSPHLITKITNKLEGLESKVFSGNSWIYYSPKAVAAIYSELGDFLSTPKAPLGWKTTSQMSQEFDDSIHKIRRIIGKLDNPEVRKYKNQQGTVRLFYSPSSVALIQKRLKEEEVGK